MDRHGIAVPDRVVGTLALHEGRPVFFHDDAFCLDPLPLSPFRRSPT
jgi:hypothetical protein